MTDKDLRVPQVFETFGRQMADAYGKALGVSANYLNFLHDSWKKTMEQTAGWSMNNGIHFFRTDNETPYRNTDLSDEEAYRWIEEAFRQGNVDSVAAYINRLRDVEAALKINEQRYRAVVEDQTQLICRYDPDGTLTFANLAFCRYFGKSCGNLIGKNLFSLFPENTQERFRRYLNTFSPDKPIRTHEHEVAMPDGSRVWLRWTNRAFFDEQGRVAEFQDVGADITDYKHMEEELIAAKIQAEDANRSKSEFLANMSHEIRTPISAIIGMTDMAIDVERREAQREKLKIIRDAAGMLLTVINDILDFSKIEAHKLELHLEDFDLYSVAEKLNSTFSAMAIEKGLDFRVDIAPDAPRHLHGDPFRLGQILNNLAGNAVKFTNKGDVHVDIRSEDQTGPDVTLLFCVRDTGLGIPEDKLPKLFQSFSQINPSYSKTYGGTGLGLAISKKLAEMMNGTIWAESKEGQGSAFCFRIKCRKSEPAVVHHHIPLSDTELRPESLTILVAEDNKTNQKFISHFLNKEGHKTLMASNGREALEILEKEPADVILMDIRMPEMNGLEAAKMIRTSKTGKFSTDIPIIALTAHTMKGDKEKFLKAGMNDYVSKPVNFDELKAAIHKAVRRDAVETKAPDNPSDMKPVSDSKPVPQALNRKAALERFAGDEALFRECTAIFINQIEDRENIFQKALAAGDMQQLSMVAHNLKSMTGTVGAETCQILSQKLETAANEKDAAKVQEICRLLEQELKTVLLLLGSDCAN